MKNIFYLKRVLLSILSILSQLIVHAQLSGSSAFLQGHYVELGISHCGTYGTLEHTPEGPFGAYHGNTFTGDSTYGLGFVADSDEDGWDAGLPEYCGDYSLPGSPTVGFGFEYDGYTYINDRPYCDSAHISGSILDYSEATDSKGAVWQGAIDDYLNISIKQITTVPNDKLFFISEYFITNTGSDSLHELYFTYNVDADNDYKSGGEFTTDNSVTSNPPDSSLAQVVATGTVYGCYYSLVTMDNRARASFGNFTLAHPQNVWTGTEGYVTSIDEFAGDVAVQMSFKLDIAPGATTSFCFAHLFSATAIDDALAFCTPAVLYANDENISTGGIKKICPGGAVTLEVESASDYSWSWSPSTYLSSASGDSVISTPETSITYTATGASLYDTLVLTVHVEVTDPFEILLTSSASLPGDSTGSATAIVMSGGIAPFSYAWNTGDTTISITGIPAGEYIVVVTDSLGCTATDTVTVGTTQSLYDLQNSNAFSIYPNPADDNGFNVHFHNSVNSAYELEILHTNGLRAAVYHFDSTDDQFINTQNLSAGFYLVKIITGDRIFLRSLVIE